MIVGDGGTSGQPASAERPGLSARKIVLLTLAVVALVVVVVGGGIAGYLAYDRKADKLRVAEEQLADLRTERERLVRSVATLQDKVQSEYLRGREEGRESAEEFNKTLGLDFAGGYKAAFEGFQWQSGAWYIIRIGRGEYGHEIMTQVDLAPCELVFLKNNSIWTRTGEYPC